MYSVFGATGKTGRAIIAALQRHDQRILAVDINPKVLDLRSDNCEVAVADILDRAAMKDVMTNASGVYLIFPFNRKVPNLLAEVAAIVRIFEEVIEEAQPSHVLALTSPGAQYAEGTGLYLISHYLERALRRTSVPRTFLRPPEFLENWCALLPIAKQTGLLPSHFYPLDRGVSQVSVIDVANTAADLLLEPTTTERVVHIEGAKRYTPLEVADIFSHHLNMPIEAVSVPRDKWVDLFVQQGISTSFAIHLAELYDAINDGRTEFGQDYDQHIIGQTTLENVLSNANTQYT